MNYGKVFFSRWIIVFALAAFYGCAHTPDCDKQAQEQEDAVMSIWDEVDAQ